MKKKYSPPEIAFESFALSVSIAQCGAPTNQDNTKCGYKWDAETMLFVSTINECNTYIVDGDENWNGLCYDNPSQDKSLYSS